MQILQALFQCRSAGELTLLLLVDQLDEHFLRILDRVVLENVEQVGQFRVKIVLQMSVAGGQCEYVSG